MVAPVTTVGLLQESFATSVSLFLRKFSDDTRSSHVKKETTMERQKILVTAIALSVIIAALTACQKEPGPAEKAGKAVDNATEKTGQQIEKAGENIQDTAKGNKK
jgi:hypothetical protein